MSSEVKDDKVYWGNILDEVNGVIDVVPVDSEGNVLFNHSVEEECWCYPDIEDDGSEYIIILHNMFH